MKKILGIFAFALILNGCDDGELTIENIDFADVTAANCGNIVYKLKETEALFFEVANYDALFINDATLAGQPRFAEVNATNRIFYRAYNGTITSDNICGSIPPATPSVAEEWTFTSDGAGRIEVETTPVIVANALFPGGEKIQQYRHKIVFRTVSKNTPSGSEILDYDFGFYTTTPNVLPFNFGETLNKCDNLITNINGSEAMTLDIDASLIANEATAPGVPRTGILGVATNKLVYSLFQTAVTSAYFCTMPTPATPLLKEQWNGDAGVSGATGIIEVTTTSGGGPGVFNHEIHLKNVTFRKGNSTFKLADDFLLGVLTTSI